MEKTTGRGAFSPNIIQAIELKMRWAGYVALVGERRGACTFFVGRKNAGKRPLGRSRRRWEDAIKIVLQEIGWDWIECGSRYVINGGPYDAVSRQVEERYVRPEGLYSVQ